MRAFVIHIAFTLAAALILHERLSAGMGGLAEFGVYVVLFFVLWLIGYFVYRQYFFSFYRALILLLYFVKELFVSNLKVISYVIMPGLRFQPALIEFELQLKSDWEIALLANLITLTPGTLTLEVSHDKKHLYFHSINVPDGDVEKMKQKIADGFEKRILAIQK